MQPRPNRRSTPPNSLAFSQPSRRKNRAMGKLLLILFFGALANTLAHAHSEPPLLIDPSQPSATR